MTSPYNRKVCDYMRKAGRPDTPKELLESIAHALANKNGWPIVAIPKEAEIEAMKKYEKRRRK